MLAAALAKVVPQVLCFQRDLNGLYRAFVFSKEERTSIGCQLPVGYRELSTGAEE
jgi:hypothetical protein